jgi:hypothetical protein
MTLAAKLYTFYLRKTDGTATHMEVFDLPSDTKVEVRANMLLLDHPSCAYAEAWEGDRLVLARYRAGALSAQTLGAG